MSDQPVAETSTWQHTTLTTYIHVPRWDSNPQSLADEGPQTYAFDRTVTGTDCDLSGSNLFSQTVRFSGGKKKKSNIKCVLIFSKILSKKFLILRRNQRNITKNTHRSDYNYTLILLTDFRKIL